MWYNMVVNKNNRDKCLGCKHLNKNNNSFIGYEICSGEYCYYKFIPVMDVLR